MNITPPVLILLFLLANVLSRNLVVAAKQSRHPTMERTKIIHSKATKPEFGRHHSSNLLVDTDLTSEEEQYRDLMVMGVISSMSMRMTQLQPPPKNTNVPSTAPSTAPTLNPTDVTLILAPGIQTFAPTVSPLAASAVHDNTCQGIMESIHIPLEIDTTTSTASGDLESSLDLVSSALASALSSEYTFCARVATTSSSLNDPTRRRRLDDSTADGIQLASVEMKDEINKSCTSQTDQAICHVVTAQIDIYPNGISTIESLTNLLLASLTDIFENGRLPLIDGILDIRLREDVHDSALLEDNDGGGSSVENDESTNSNPSSALKEGRSGRTRSIIFVVLSAVIFAILAFVVIRKLATSSSAKQPKPLPQEPSLDGNTEDGETAVVSSV